MDKIFSCSDHNYIIKTKNNKYIFHLINGDMSYLINGFSGSVLKNISKTYLINLQIPVPKSPEKIQEWVDKISKPYNEKNEKQARVKELEINIQNRIKEITENEDCDEVELGSICDFKSGKYSTSEMNNNGIYPFYNATTNSIGNHSEYCFDNEKYLLLIKSGNIKANTLGSVVKVMGKTACVTDVVQIISSINIDYLYYILKQIKNEIRKTSNSSVGLAHLRMTQVKELKIKIPKNKTDMESTFQEIETLQTEIKTAEELYKQYIKELINEATPKPTSEVIIQNMNQKTNK